MKSYFIIIFLTAVVLSFTMYECNSSYAKMQLTNNDDNEFINKQKILLGKYLFFDRRLSANNTKSCGTCHNPAFAFTDGYKRSLGAYADLHQRNTAPLFNLAQVKFLTAADSSLHTAFQQMDNPLFNTHPVEMGAGIQEQKLFVKLMGDPLYKTFFANCFPAEKNAVNWVNIKTAVSNFVNMIVSYDSPFDKYQRGDSNALSITQKKGKQLFYSAALQCTQCHGGQNFSTSAVTDKENDTIFYFNTGLYNVDNKSEYPNYDEGLYEHTNNVKDKGKYKVPTLRNLAFTAPYYHDGSAASLMEVINNYAAGGRKIMVGQDKGNGAKNKYKHPLIKGFIISENEKKDIINFLLALSDSALVKNPAYQNPFAEDETKNK